MLQQSGTDSALVGPPLIHSIQQPASLTKGVQPLARPNFEAPVSDLHPACQMEPTLAFDRRVDGLFQRGTAR